MECPPVCNHREATLGRQMCSTENRLPVAKVGGVENESEVVPALLFPGVIFK